MERLPAGIEAALAAESHVEAIARRYADSRSAFYIGRGPGFPIALEGAQKLKEISYIHAEAYPASELKHGPLALIGPDIPPSSRCRTTRCSTSRSPRSRRCGRGAVR